MWSFAQSQNSATIVSKSIMDGRLPILLVVHETYDDSWTFLDGEPFSPETAMIVALESVIAVDPSMVELATMEAGWQAERKSVSSPWVFERCEEDLEE